MWINLQRKYRREAEAIAAMNATMMAILCLPRKDASAVSLCLFRALLLFPLKLEVFSIMRLYSYYKVLTKILIAYYKYSLHAQ